MKYVKTIIIIGCVLVAFGAGLWTGCGANGDTQKELNRSIKINERAAEIVRDSFRRLKEAEGTINRLNGIVGEITEENKRLTDRINQIGYTNTSLTGKTITGAGLANRAENILIDSLKILQAENNNN